MDEFANFVRLLAKRPPVHDSATEIVNFLSINFLMSKIISSNFYNKHILPRSFGHFDIVLDGSKIISETEEEFV